MNAGVYDFCIREARSTLIGMLLGTPARFMSAPPSVWAAENKLYQLEMAGRLGIPIPKTVFTNRPQAIRDAFRACAGRMIIKPAKSGYVDYGPEQHAIFTNRFLEEHLERLETASLCPAIYQELLDKACDVRVTVVGRKVFVAEIDSQSDPAAVIDWRHTSNPNLPHRPGTLPPKIEKGILDLLNTLGLSFGAIDLVKTTDGDYKFLEVNPNGQWLWLEDMLGFEISREIARWRAVGSDRRRARRIRVRDALDVFWPSSSAVDEAEVKKLEKRREDECDAIVALKGDEQALERALESSVAILTSERERSASVDARLGGILSLASVASALVLASVTFLSKKAEDLGLIRWSVILVALLGAYIAVQFLRAVQAAVSGMWRRSVNQDTFLALVQQGKEARGPYLTRILQGHAKTRKELYTNIDDKVTCMAIAHQAIKNATVALIIAALFLCAATIQRAFVRSGSKVSAVAGPQ